MTTTFTASRSSLRATRIMVRQPQSKANAGAFNNWMPTSSMGCGIWGGNITNDNLALKHYINVTWAADCRRPPTEQELFGEFYNTDVFEEEEVTQAVGLQ
jgi:sulfoacetaldehyde dehydrogenase